MINKIYKPIKKESNVTGEAGATIAAICKKIKKSKIDITVNYSNAKLRVDKSFLQQPRQILMKRCGTESKTKRRLIEQNRIRNPIKHHRIKSSYRKRVLMDKNINVLIREIDTRDHEEKVIQHLLPE